MRTGQLLFRLYLGCLVTVTIAMGLSFLYFTQFRKDRQQEAGHLTEHFVSDLAQHRQDPQRLRAEVARLKHYARLHVSLYDPAGHLLASTVQPPLPMVSPSELSRLASSGQVRLAHGQVAHAVSEDGHLVAIGVASHRGLPPGVPIAQLATVLILFMIAAVLFARHLAKPLQEMARAAERFGRGELSARTGVRRSDEIGVAAKAFDEMADRVAWLMTAQRELMANVSHELRTPLSRIHVAVDLLLDGVSDKAQEFLPEIARDLEELERLIDDVMVVTRLDLSRARDPRAGTPLKIETLSVPELLHKAAARFRAQHQTHELIVEVAPGIAALSADAVLLRRVIENLIDNARKYSEPGSVIRVSGEKSARGVRVVVSDFGIGMDSADLQQVFTPFFRSDRSRSRTTGGVGLGLSLARRVIEAHDGIIDLESASGHGTTVTIDLPMQPLAAARHSS